MHYLKAGMRANQRLHLTPLRCAGEARAVRGHKFHPGRPPSLWDQASMERGVGCRDDPFDNSLPNDILFFDVPGHKAQPRCTVGTKAADNIHKGPSVARGMGLVR